MKYLCLPFIVLNILAVLLLWAAALFSTLNPNTYGWLSLSGYALPFIALLNVAFIALWIFIKKRFVLISVAGLLAAYSPITLYCPLNTSTADADLPDSLITVLSYNTSNWGDWETSPDKQSTAEEKLQTIRDFLKQNNPDIVFLQESPLNEKATSVTSAYQYVDTVACKKSRLGVVLTLLSKYPIIKKENLNIESKANACGAFWINFHGREVILINTHLEVMHFSMKERKQLSTIVHGNQKDRDSIRNTSQTLIGKIYNSTKIHAVQAEQIAQFISRHRDTPIILAGDFNDIPNSYAHKTILGAFSADSSSLWNSDEDGTDCYATTGFGPGYTFKHFGIRERIDNIMCSRHFTPYNCTVVKYITISDHQPIVCKLKIGN